MVTYAGVSLDYGGETNFKKWDVACVDQEMFERCFDFLFSFVSATVSITASLRLVLCDAQHIVQQGVAVIA